MYCVKCGVRLPDSAEKCPLCQTPVWHPETEAAEPEPCKSPAYPLVFPEQQQHARIAGVAFVTVVLSAICLACLIFCLKSYHSVSWSGYVMLGIALVYTVAILPLWFRCAHPMIFVPVSFAAVCGYLLYICLYTGGHWFLSFAFPVVMLVCLVTTGSLALFRYVRHGRLFIIGGLLVVIGGGSMLVELFQCLTFGGQPFHWSIYTASVFGWFGLFFILAGIVKPLRDYLERKFFL
jgi:hypothetical protein